MDEIPNSLPSPANETGRRLTPLIETAIREGIAPCAAAAIFHRGELVLDAQWGWQNPETRRPLDGDDLFDLASLTKLFTVTAFLRQVSAGKTTLDTPLAAVVPEFAAITPRAVVDSYEPQSRVVVPMPPEYAGKHVDPASVTFRHLLTHTSGLPPWRKTYELAAASAPPPPHLPDLTPREMRWARVLGALCALDFVGIPGDAVRYSDVGLMLTGEAVARLDGRGLAEAVRSPLAANGIHEAAFRPVASGVPYDKTVPTENDPDWRERRAWGEVHDENACGAGGISGHAGLFANARAVAAFGQLWLGDLKNSTGHLGIAPELLREAVREHAQTDGMRRGIGWMIKPIEGASCGDLFSPDSFGHTGFTGTSLWIDPARELVIALLTNRVYPGRDKPGILDLRRAVHTAVVESLA